MKNGTCYSGNSVGVKHTVLPDGQPPTVAFTVVAQLCGPEANETEMGAALFTKNSKGRSFEFCLLLCQIHIGCREFRQRASRSTASALDHAWDLQQRWHLC